MMRISFEIKYVKETQQVISHMGFMSGYLFIVAHSLSNYVHHSYKLMIFPSEQNFVFFLPPKFHFLVRSSSLSFSLTFHGVSL